MVALQTKVFFIIKDSVRETREAIKATPMGRSLSPTPSEPPKYQASLGRQTSDLVRILYAKKSIVNLYR